TTTNEKRRRMIVRMTSAHNSQRTLSESGVFGPPHHEGLNLAPIRPLFLFVVVALVLQDLAKSPAASGTSGDLGSNHDSLNSMRFLCFIAMFETRAMMASPIATVPLQRRSFVSFS